MNNNEIRNLAECYLMAMDTLENNPRFPDGIMARETTDGIYEFDTFKLVYGPSAGWVEVDRVDQFNFGEGYEQINGSYVNDEQIDAMVENLNGWDTVYKIDEILKNN